MVADSLIYDGFRTAVSLNDINGDGKWDMLLGNYSGGLSLLYGLIVNTSVSEWDGEASLRAFPVPASETLYWELPQSAKVTRIAVTDLNGRVLINRAELAEGPGSIDISGLSSGLYLLRIHFSSGVEKVVRWLKQ